MEPLNLMVVGCGMMGARHLRGLAELERVRPGSLRLLAVCDPREESANRVADEATDLLGERPQVFAGVEEAIIAEPSLDAVDLVTDPRFHDGLAVSLLEAGLHVLCEKPLALTVERGARMIEAAGAAGRVLATAENNRRDPMARLARACIEAGLIGKPNFVIQTHVNSGSGVVATAWRHRLAMGGVLLDVAIHLSYMLEYHLGPLDIVTAGAWLEQPLRSGKEYDGNEVAVEVDAEDVFAAIIEFGSGVSGQWVTHFASAGETLFKRLIFGTEGTVDIPGERSGQPPAVRRGGEQITGGALLAALPNWRLEGIEEELWGERPAQYALDYPIIDRRLIATEVHDFAEAIRTGTQLESDGTAGLRAVAIIYAVLESALIGRPVRIDEVLGGELRAYQEMVEAAE